MAHTCLKRLPRRCAPRNDNFIMGWFGGFFVALVRFRRVSHRGPCAAVHGAELPKEVAASLRLLFQLAYQHLCRG
jgi:hypothetical protein